jgi:hypothetical protein
LDFLMGYESYLRAQEGALQTDRKTSSFDTLVDVFSFQGHSP